MFCYTGREENGYFGGVPIMRLGAKRQAMGLIAAVVLLGTVVFFAKAATTTSTPNVPRSYMATVVVRSGDTLWTIAGRNMDGEGDVRKVIYEIRKANGLQNAALQPGQALVVPVAAQNHY